MCGQPAGQVTETGGKISDPEKARRGKIRSVSRGNTCMSTAHMATAHMRVTQVE